MSRKENKISKRRLRSSYFTSIISISLVLFLLGLMGLLILNAKKLSDYVKENIGFSVILKDNVKEVDILQLQKNLDAAKYVKSTEYITKERAAKEFQEELGEDFLDILDENPLSSLIDVRFYANYANSDSISLIEADLKKYSQIKEVYYEKSLIHMVNENVRNISLFILSFSSLLFLIAIALINNTIRLSVYSKRFIINTMQIVGATRNFIRRPFLYKSAIHGIYAAILAVSFLSGMLYYTQNEIKEIFTFQDFEIIGILFLLIVLLGIIINWISTYFAVRKFLNFKTDDLY